MYVGALMFDIIGLILSGSLWIFFIIYIMYIFLVIEGFEFWPRIYFFSIIIVQLLMICFFNHFIKKIFFYFFIRDFILFDNLFSLSFVRFFLFAFNFFLSCLNILSWLYLYFGNLIFLFQILTRIYLLNGVYLGQNNF